MGTPPFTPPRNVARDDCIYLRSRRVAVDAVPAAALPARRALRVLPWYRFW